jgi:glycosyltransferase involved in cell wall biosynthesis
MNKTLAILSNNFPPTIDGVGDYSFILSKKLEESGCEIFIISKVNMSAQYKPSKFLGIKNGWRSFSTYSQIRQFLKSKNIQKLSVQYVPYAFSRIGLPFGFVLGMIYLKLMGFQIYTTFHEISIYKSNTSFRNKFIGKSQIFLANLLHRFSTKSLVSIQYNFDLLKSKNKIFFSRIPSNINKSEFIPKEKSYDVAIFGIRNYQIFKSFLDSNPNYSIVIIGKCPKECTNLVNKDTHPNIHLTGMLENSQISKFLSLSRIGLVIDKGGVSTKSGTIAAYFQHHLPVVGENGHLTDSFFTDGQNVDFYSDIDGLNKCVSTLITDEKYYQTRKEQTIKTYENSLSKEVLLKNYLSLLSNE